VKQNLGTPPRERETPKVFLRFLSPMASHIILPPDDDDEQRQGEEEDPWADAEPPAAPEQAAKAALPFSATCVRISRDSYPNLRALRNASSVSLADAAYVKISE
ncbi:hypothetical protein P5E51_16115, partial [Clostridium perfringens]|nr:hypothetical protein [Clostridium perfringens]